MASPKKIALDLDEMQARLAELFRQRLPMQAEYDAAVEVFNATTPRSDPDSVIAHADARTCLAPVAPSLKGLDAETSAVEADVRAVVRAAAVESFKSARDEVTKAFPTFISAFSASGAEWATLVATLNRFCSTAADLGHTDAHRWAGAGECGEDADCSFRRAAGLPVPGLRTSLAERLASIESYAARVIGA